MVRILRPLDGGQLNWLTGSRVRTGWSRCYSAMIPDRNAPGLLPVLPQSRRETADRLQFIARLTAYIGRPKTARFGVSQAPSLPSLRDRFTLQALKTRHRHQASAAANSSPGSRTAFTRSHPRHRTGGAPTSREYRRRDLTPLQHKQVADITFAQACSWASSLAGGSKELRRRH